MAVFGSNFAGGSFAGSNAGRYIHIQKHSLSVGTVQSVSVPRGVVTSHDVLTDIDETASAIVTVKIYSQTAEGESPQLQAIVGTGEGGGGKGRTRINPGVKVTIETEVSGASTPVGITAE